MAIHVQNRNHIGSTWIMYLEQNRVHKCERYTRSPRLNFFLKPYIIIDTINFCYALIAAHQTTIRKYVTIYQYIFRYVSCRLACLPKDRFSLHMFCAGCCGRHDDRFPRLAAGHAARQTDRLRLCAHVSRPPLETTTAHEVVAIFCLGTSNYLTLSPALHYITLSRASEPIPFADQILVQGWVS
jgi:hypothetical protein